jgi:hypothetical protein
MCVPRVNHAHIDTIFKFLQHWRISMHPCWRVCGENLNIVSMCAVSPVVNASNFSSQKKTFSIFMWLSFGFLVINVCNNGENYETPCIFFCVRKIKFFHLLKELCVIHSLFRNNQFHLHFQYPAVITWPVLLNSVWTCQKAFGTGIWH